MRTTSRCSVPSHSSCGLCFLQKQPIVNELHFMWLHTTWVSSWTAYNGCWQMCLWKDNRMSCNFCERSWLVSRAHFKHVMLVEWPICIWNCSSWAQSSQHSCCARPAHMKQDVPRDLGALRWISQGDITLFPRLKMTFRLGSKTFCLEGVAASQWEILEGLFHKNVAEQRPDFCGVAVVVLQLATSSTCVSPG